VRQRLGERLLARDVLARGDRAQGDATMRLAGSVDEDGVHVATREQPIDVVEWRRVAELSRPCARLVDIPAAHRDDSASWRRNEAGQDDPSRPIIEPDERQAHDSVHPRLLSVGPSASWW